MRYRHFLGTGFLGVLLSLPAYAQKTPVYPTIQPPNPVARQAPTSKPVLDPTPQATPAKKPAAEPVSKPASGKFIPREPYYPDNPKKQKSKPLQTQSQTSSVHSVSKSVSAKTPIQTEPEIPDTVPSLNSKNMISLPWETFLSLWNQARDPEIRRQLPYAYGKVLYIGSARIENENYLITFNASFEITTYGESEKLVPFLASSLNIETIVLDNKPSTWAEKNGYLHVLVSGEGEHTLSARFTVKIPSQNWPRAFDMPLVPIPQNEFVLHLPDLNVEGNFEPGVTLDPIFSETGSQLSAVIPAATQVSIRWSHRTEGQENIPVKMTADLYTFANLDLQGASFHATVNYKILQGNTGHFNLLLPGEADVLEVTSTDPSNPVDQWYVEDSPTGKNLNVNARKRQADAYGLDVHYTQSASDVSLPLTLFLLDPQNVERTESWLGIGSANTVEIAESRIADAERQDIRFLPPALKDLTQNQALFFYKQTAPRPVIEFSVKPRERAALPTLQIDRLEADTTLAENGSVITHAVYFLKNSQAQFLKLKLPARAKLFRAALNGKEIQPALDDEGVLLIPVIKSAETAFPIEIVIQEPAQSLSFLGRKSLELPKTDSATSEIAWNLDTPDGFQMIHFGGNVSSTGKRPSDIFAVQKQTRHFSGYLLKEPVPRLVAYYISRNLQRAIALVVSFFFFGFVFFSLAFAFERKNLPPAWAHNTKRYLKIASAAVLITLGLGLLSLDVAFHVLAGILAAVAVFAVWQNRRMARRCQALASRKTRLVPGFFLFIFVGVLILFFAGLDIVVFSVSIVVLTGLQAVLSFALPRFLKKAPLFTVLAVLMTCVYHPNVRAVEEVEPVSSEVQNAQVNVEWPIIENILKKIEARERRNSKKAGVDYVFGSPQVGGEISRHYVEIRISLPFRILADTYAKIPLVSDNTAITEVLLNGKNLSLNREEGRVYFEMRKLRDETNTLQVSLIVPVVNEATANQFTLESPLLKGSVLEMGFDPEIQSIRFKNAVWQKKEGGKIRAALGSEERLEGEFFTTKQENTESGLVKPKKIYAESRTLVSLGEEEALFLTHIHYAVVNDEVRSFTFRLPADVVVHKVEGDAVETWNADIPLGGQTVYNVKLSHSVGGTADILVDYEVPFRVIDGNFDVPPLEVLNVARTIGYVGLEMKAQAELVLREAGKGRMIDIRELPAFIAEKAVSPLVYAFRCGQDPCLLSFTVAQHDKLEMDTSSVRSASFVTVISPQGKVVVQAHLVVNNSRRSFATLILPPRAKIQSVYLDNDPISPSENDDGALEVPLKQNPDEPFMLDIVYEDASAHLNATMGLLQIRYPKLDLPLDSVSAEFYVPGNLVFSRFYGNLYPAERSEPLDWLKKKWKSSLTAGPAEPALMKTEEQTTLGAEMPVSDQMEAKNVAGTLPLKIEVPKKGRRLLLAGSSLPENGTIKAGFVFFHPVLYYAFYLVLMFYFVSMGQRIPALRNKAKVNWTPWVVCLIVLVLAPLAWEETVILLCAGWLVQAGRDQVKARRIAKYISSKNKL